MRTWLDRVVASAVATSLAFFVPLGLPTPAKAAADSACSAWATGAGPAPAPTSCHAQLEEHARKTTRIASRSMSKNEWLEREVMTLEGGRGDKSSEPFKLSADFEIRWENESDDLEIILHKGSGLTEVKTRVVGLGAPGRGSKGYPRSDDEYFIEVTASGPWSLTVIEKARDVTYDYDLTVQAKLRNPFSVPIVVSYDFGDSTTKSVEIAAESETVVTEPLSLTDQADRYTNERLLKEVSPLKIHSVLNASPEAQSARDRQASSGDAEKAAKEAELAAAQEANRQRADAASVEYQTIDRDERRKEMTRQQQDELALNRDARNAETSRRRKLVTIGVVSGALGVGGGIALMVVGASIRSQGKSNYDQAAADLAVDPTPSKTLRLQDAKKEIDRGRTFLGIGGGLFVLGAAGAAVCLGMAFGGKSQAKRSQAWQPTIAPMLVRRGGGLVLHATF